MLLLHEANDELSCKLDVLKLRLQLTVSKSKAYTERRNPGSNRKSRSGTTSHLGCQLRGFMLDEKNVASRKRELGRRPIVSAPEIGLERS